MKFIICFLIRYFCAGLLLLTTCNVFAQRLILPKDTTSNAQLVKTDTLTKKPDSNSDLNSTVTYKAGNEFIDLESNILYFIGKARVTYTDLEVDADFIRIDQKNNEIFSKGSIDTVTRRYTGRPIFRSSSQPPSAVDSLAYNYKTKKAKAYGTSSEIEGGYILAGELKKNDFNEVFNRDFIYTTCNLPHPHFGIHAKRVLITEKQIMTGPAYLEIEDVPIPLGIPFGFFPKTNRRASGILFPTFGEDFSRGFFMRDLGYYIGLNDYWDTGVRATLYSKGSYEANVLGSYRRNYKYDGRINLRYASTKTGVEGTPTYLTSKDFNIQWSHSQRPEANPGTTFSASVNIGTSSYFTRTAAGGTYDIGELTRNNLSSGISYGRTFVDGLFNFTSTLSHRQDLNTKSIFIELPTFNLSMASLNPFDSKERLGEQKWYQRISLGYSLQGSNSIDTKENLLFQKGSLQKFRNGFQHNIPVNLSLNVFKFFQLGTSVQYSEKWYLQTIRKNFNPATNLVEKDTLQGFRRAYEYTLSTGLSTKLYGLKQFRKGKLLALRHVMTPSVSLNYRPDFGSNSFGYYKDVQTDAAGNIQRYSIFEDGVYGSPGSGKIASVGFNLENTIEAKLRPKSSDTTNVPQKVSILQGLSFSGNYNFVADSFKLSAINFNGRTVLFKNAVGVNFFGTFDPYKMDNTGRRVNSFSIHDGKLARLTNAGLSFDFSLNSEATANRNKAIGQALGGTSVRTPAQAEQLARISRDPNAFVDFNIPWNVSASYSFNYSKMGLQPTITNTLNLYGDISVTPKWKVQYTSGYDFQSSRISITQFSIYRDLHCWDMAFNWVPIGLYRSYSVNIKVKASILQDLKLSRRRDYYNNF